LINFRYHLATLIAVFLALGLGVVAGSTFISPATVSALQRSLQALDARDRALEDNNNLLAGQNRTLMQYAQASRDLMVRDVLKGRPVLLLSFDSTPGAETAEVATTLVEAGARLEGSIILSSNLALPDDPSRQQVATTIGVTASTSDAVASALVRALADTLSGRAPGLFQRLLDAGLVTKGSGVTPDAAQPPASLPTQGSSLVILAPLQPQGTPKSSPDLGRTLILPLVRALSATSIPLAVGEDGSTALAVLTLLRQDSTLHVVTVDGADTPMGQAAIVLGLQRAASGVWGSYGSGAGAVPLPSPAPTPSATPIPGATAIPSAAVRGG
jgi:hypothetical protein